MKAPYAVGDLYSAVLMHDGMTTLAYLRITAITPNGIDNERALTWRITGAGGSITHSAIVRSNGTDRHGYVSPGLAA